MIRKTIAALAIAAAALIPTAVALGSGPATAACTTFDEHNRVVMRDCPSGGAGSAPVPNGGDSLSPYTPPERSAPEADDEVEEPTEPTEPTEPADPGNDEDGQE